MSAILIITLITSILSLLGLAALSYMFFTSMKKVENLPTEFGAKIRNVRGLGGKLQKEMDNLARMDIGKFIEENPVVVDIFPTLVEKGITKNAQPQMISSIVGLIAPALTSLLMNNSNAPEALKAIAGGSGTQIIGGIFKALGALRENAKKTHQKKDGTVTDTDKKVLPAARVKSI